MIHKNLTSLSVNLERSGEAKDNFKREFFWIKTLSVRLNRSQRITPQITDFIKDLIFNKELLPGDRLPSIHDLSDELVVNHRTVENAYAFLESQEVLEKIGKRGTYVKRLPETPLKDLRKVLKQKPAFSFKNTARPGYDRGYLRTAWLQVGYPFPDLNDSLDRDFATECGNAMSFYSIKDPNKRKKQSNLQETLMALIAQRGMQVNDNQVLFSNQGKLVAQEILRNLLFDGDCAVLASPADNPYFPLISGITTAVSFTGADCGGMITSTLETICRSRRVKVVVVRSSVDYERSVALSENRRLHLLELAEQYNFVILEIDDYPDSHYGENSLPLIARAENPRVIYISSLTVTLTTVQNFKIIIGPSVFIAKLKQAQYVSDSVMDKVTDRALACILNSPKQQQQLKKLNSKGVNTMRNVSEMARFHLGDFACCYQPSAGLSLWINFRIPAPKELVESIFARHGLTTRRKGNPRATNISGIKIAFGVIDLLKLESALADLAKRLLIRSITL